MTRRCTHFNLNKASQIARCPEKTKVHETVPPIFSWIAQHTRDRDLVVAIILLLLTYPFSLCIHDSKRVSAESCLHLYYICEFVRMLCRTHLKCLSKCMQMEYHRPALDTFTRVLLRDSVWKHPRVICVWAHADETLCETPTSQITFCYAYVRHFAYIILTSIWKPRRFNRVYCADWWLLFWL